MTDPNQPGYPPPGSHHPGGAPGSGQHGAPQHQPAHEPESKLRFSVGQIIGAILLILLIIFIVENSHNVGIRIIAGPEVHPPVWVAILIAAVLGGLISVLLRYQRRVSARRKAQLREHKAENS
jgi:uncharacterized integral membrane protein